MTHLAGFNVVNPTCDLGLLEDQRMGPDELHFFFDSLVKVREFQELDGIGSRGNSLRIAFVCGSLELLPKVMGRKRLHSTVGVVEDGDFTSPQQPLGDDQRSDRVLSASD